MGKLPFEGVERKVITKREGTPNAVHGLDPTKRPIKDLLEYGIVNVDKPAGPTSHQVSAYTKEILDRSKAGHSGTLDPNVTGVLVIAMGKGTRVIHTLLTAGKEYVGIMHLHGDISEYKIYETCNKFMGKIDQLPPVRSAVKRRMRERSIYYFEIMEINGRDVLFRVGCQAGTYIRKLCHDVGEELKCGAHMAELRRTKAGPFTESTLCTLHDLKDAYHFYKEDGNEKMLRALVHPMETAVAHMAKVWVLDNAVHSMAHGANLCVPGVSKLHEFERGERIAVMTLKGELVGLGEATMSTEKIMLKDKGVCVKVDKVFIDQELYPKVLN